MLPNLSATLAPAVLQRLTLALNHVLRAEPQAQARLKPHARRVILLRLADTPGWWPSPPPMAWQVTPAGMFEWLDATDAALPAPDLHLRLSLGDPLSLAGRVLEGTPPPVAVEGDAELASTVQWLLQNLRWDAGADLQRLFGPLVGAQIESVGAAVLAGLRGALRAGAPVVRRWMPAREAAEGTGPSGPGGARNGPAAGNARGSSSGAGTGDPAGPGSAAPTGNGAGATGSGTGGTGDR